jgi:hypothetical protein
MFVATERGVTELVNNADISEVDTYCAWFESNGETAFETKA